MSRNGSGTYNLPAGNPVVTATTITSAWANTTLSDIASALTGSLAADGQTPATGNLNMNTNRITNVVDPTLSQDAATKVYVDTSVATINSVITGSIQMWPTATAPTGYLLCAGAAVSRTTYATLFAVIGTTFGVGDGTTTFNLPNYSDRMPYGTTIGSTGGSKDAVVVSHTHTLTDPGHNHTTGTSSSGGGALTSGSQLGYATNTGTSTTGITIASAGVSGTNANLPPYLGINFIIKV
jgi:microcystin-dependent protein